MQADALTYQDLADFSTQGFFDFAQATIGDEAKEGRIHILEQQPAMTVQADKRLHGAAQDHILVDIGVEVLDVFQVEREHLRAGRRVGVKGCRGQNGFHDR